MEEFESYTHTFSFNFTLSYVRRMVSKCRREVKRIDNIMNGSEIFSKDLFEHIRNCVDDRNMMSQTRTLMYFVEDVTPEIRDYMSVSRICLEKVLETFVTHETNERFTFRENVPITDTCRRNVKQGLHCLYTISRTTSFF